MHQGNNYLPQNLGKDVGQNVIKGSVPGLVEIINFLLGTQIPCGILSTSLLLLTLIKSSGTGGQNSAIKLSHGLEENDRVG